MCGITYHTTKRGRSLPPKQRSSVTIQIEPKDLELVDAAVKAAGYKSRHRFILDAVIEKANGIIAKAAKK
jgi:uncharacterized protein (DUF1778 family)